MLNDLINKPVLVRSQRAGVWLGVLEDAQNGALRIRGRRLWEWSGAIDYTVLATQGPKAGRIGPTVTTTLLPQSEVFEVTAATPAALSALESIAPCGTT